MTAVLERYGKHVKAILQVGDERTDDYKVRLGYPAEIVPLVNPYVMSVGDELVVQCLVDGESVSGQLVIAGGQSADGTIAERNGRTDESGKIRFTIDRPGRWYIKFVHMVKLESDPDVDYESKWATLTFAVARLRDRGRVVQILGRPASRVDEWRTNRSMLRCDGRSAASRRGVLSSTWWKSNSGSDQVRGLK